MPDALDVPVLLDALAAEGPRLVAAARRAGLDAPVPPCPDWTVGDLVVHLGGVHRWATGIVRDRLDHEPPGELEQPAAEADLLAWFSAGHVALVAALRAAPADLACFTFLPAPSPLAHWVRRQAHETAIHRADVEAAGGTITPFDAGFAHDGIAELLLGFLPRRRSRVTATLAVRPDDGAPAWRVRLSADRIVADYVADHEAGPADATVAGSPSDLYLWLWNRPSGARVSGDAEVAAAWRKVRVRWS